MRNSDHNDIRKKRPFFKLKRAVFVVTLVLESNTNNLKVRDKMDKYVTLKELAMMTGLTARTLRNYMKTHVLQGEKQEGIWMFTLEEIGAFFSDPGVKASIRTKRNAVVYDYLLDDHKTDNEICSILDFCVDDREAVRISEFFSNAANQIEDAGRFRFSYDKSGNCVRVILKGSAEQVMKIMNNYYFGS